MPLESSATNSVSDTNCGAYSIETLVVVGQARCSALVAGVVRT